MLDTAMTAISSPVRKFVRKADHACRGGKRAREHLTLAADVPEAHPERGRHCERNAQQQRDVLAAVPISFASVPNGAVISWSNRPEGGFRLSSALVTSAQNEQREHDGRRADAPRLDTRAARRGFDDMKQRRALFCLFIGLTSQLRHHHADVALRSAAACQQYRLPCRRTGQESCPHSSSSTSRSSPT